MTVPHRLAGTVLAFVLGLQPLDASAESLAERLRGEPWRVLLTGADGASLLEGHALAASGERVHLSLRDTETGATYAFSAGALQDGGDEVVLRLRGDALGAPPPARAGRAGGPTVIVAPGVGQVQAELGSVKAAVAVAAGEPSRSPLSGILRMTLRDASSHLEATWAFEPGGPSGAGEWRRLEALTPPAPIAEDADTAVCPP